MTTFLHTFHPSAVAFTLGPLSIHWYGITMVTAMVVGLQVGRYLAKSVGIKPDQVYDLGFYLILFSLLGARIYAVLLNLPFYLANPWEIPAVWHGGLAIHGAIIAGVVTLWVYSRRHPLFDITPLKIRGDQQGSYDSTVTPPTPSYPKRGVISFWLWADICAVVIALGQAIGRWGNYFNQELFGRPTGLPWGIPIDPQFRPLGFEQFVYFHPTFFYESALNFANFILLLFFWKLAKEGKGVRGEGQGTSALNPKPFTLNPGSITAIYLINYGIIRILMEQLRLDDAPEWLGLRWPIITSVALIAVGIVVLVSKMRYTKKV